MLVRSVTRHVERVSSATTTDRGPARSPGESTRQRESLARERCNDGPRRRGSGTKTAGTRGKLSLLRKIRADPFVVELSDLLADECVPPKWPGRVGSGSGCRMMAWMERWSARLVIVTALAGGCGGQATRDPAAGSGGTTPEVGGNGSSSGLEGLVGCQPDPLDDHWQVSSFEDVGVTHVSVGAGGDLMVVAYGIGELGASVGFFARTSTTPGVWSEEVRLGVNAPGGVSSEVRVTADGSGALVSWVEGDSTHVSIYDGAVWSTQELEPPGVGFWSDGNAEMLPGGRAIAAWGTPSGIRTLEYDGAGWREGGTREATFGGLFLGRDGEIVVYGFSNYSAEPDGRYVYEFGGSFGPAEPLPPAETDPYFIRHAFEFPNGRAARVLQRWANEETAGLYLTVRSNAGWGAEQRVAPYLPSGTNPLAVTHGGEDLVLLWDDEGTVKARRHTGTLWDPDEVLPLSRSATTEAWAGSLAGSVLLAGAQHGTIEDYHVTNIWRRSADGTWPCPRVANGATGIVADGTDAGAFIVSHRQEQTLFIAQFVP